MHPHSPPVVVTRPLAQALPLVERIEALGRNAVVFPLLVIEPMADDGALRQCLSHLDQYAMVAFVSPNAIDIALPLTGRLAAWPGQVAIAVVGEGSRKALARHGLDASTARIFSPRDPLRSDSETLIEALDLDALRGKRALIVRGESGREFLGDALRAAGIRVEQVAAYRRSAPQLDATGIGQLVQLLDSGADWLITSSEALRILIDLSRQAGGPAAVSKMQQQRIIVPHARIADTAHALGCLNVERTASGDEHLLAAIQSRP